jgi:hypothetical protein
MALLTRNEIWVLTDKIVSMMFNRDEKPHGFITLGGIDLESWSILVKQQIAGHTFSHLNEILIGPGWTISLVVGPDFEAIGLEGDQQKAERDLMLIQLSGDIGADFRLLTLMNERESGH